MLVIHKLEFNLILKYINLVGRIVLLIQLMVILKTLIKLLNYAKYCLYLAQ